MKSLLLIGAVLFSISSQAQVAVGTWATYNISLTGEDGSTLAGTEKVTALEVNATQTLLETVQIANGNTSVEKDWTNNDEVHSAQIGQAIVDNCANPEIGGVIETVTVPAGTFTACKIGDEAEAALWFGAVHYGYLKMTAHGLMDDGNGNEVKVFMKRELTGTSK